MKKIFLGLCLILNSTLGFSETYKIGLEPLPPFIVDEKSGLSLQLLKAIEKELPGDTFTITIAPYNRLKTGLKDGEYHMIGHTPFAQEVKEFYAYAQDVN